jgi:hypothetical protein
MTFCMSNTYPDWIASMRSQPAQGPVNFWRKDKRTLHLETGAFVYFKLGRKIVGRGAFLRQAAMSIDEAWRQFGPRNGADTRDQFEARAVSALQISKEQPISCLILDRLELLEEDSCPEISEADFSRYIQAHKFFDDNKLDLEVFRGRSPP